MSFDWKSIVKSVAPVLGAALGGGPLGGMAVKAVADSLFGDEELPKGRALDKKIHEALVNDPAALAKIKQADNAFETRMRELDIDVMQIAADDRASARNMQKSVKSKIVPSLAVLTVLGFFVVVGWVLSGKITLESTLLGFVLGQVSAKAEQVYNFYFGSSAGSKEKTDKLTAAPTK